MSSSDSDADEEDEEEYMAPSVTTAPRIMLKRRSSGQGELPCTVIGCLQVFTRRDNLRRHLQSYRHAVPSSIAASYVAHPYIADEEVGGYDDMGAPLDDGNDNQLQAE